MMATSSNTVRDNAENIYDSLKKFTGNAHIEVNQMSKTQRPVIPGLLPLSLQNADRESIRNIFGTVTLYPGTKLYRHYSRIMDDKSDFYMRSSGSGFFSITSDSGRSIPDWVYNVERPIELLDLQRMTSAGRLDIVPEFVYAITGICHGLNLMHGHFDRGVTTCASGVKFQMTALNTGPEPFKRILKPFVQRFWSQMNEIGFKGWLGADKDGRLEVCLQCPIDSDMISFEGLWQER